MVAVLETRSAPTLVNGRFVRLGSSRWYRGHYHVAVRLAQLVLAGKHYRGRWEQSTKAPDGTSAVVVIRTTEVLKETGARGATSSTTRRSASGRRPRRDRKEDGRRLLPSVCRSSSKRGTRASHREMRDQVI